MLWAEILQGHRLHRHDVVVIGGGDKSSSTTWVAGLLLCALDLCLAQSEVLRLDAARMIRHAKLIEIGGTKLNLVLEADQVAQH